MTQATITRQEVWRALKHPATLMIFGACLVFGAGIYDKAKREQALAFQIAQAETAARSGKAMTCIGLSKIKPFKAGEFPLENKENSSVEWDLLKAGGCWETNMTASRIQYSNLSITQFAN